jgi:hypothetical protein
VATLTDLDTAPAAAPAAPVDPQDEFAQGFAAMRAQLTRVAWLLAHPPTPSDPLRLDAAVKRIVWQRCLATCERLSADPLCTADDLATADAAQYVALLAYQTAQKRVESLVV